MDFQSKDELPYSFLVFKQVERINMIMSNDVCDINQFARSVDSLKIITAHLMDTNNIDFDNQKKKETKTYETVAKQFFLTMETLGKKGLLNEWSLEAKFDKG